MKFYIIFCLFIAVPLSAGAPEPSPSFLIPATQNQPKRSTRGLKEDMGDRVEDAMHMCARLQKELGALQVTLSDVQSHLLCSGRRLLENSGPIKKAKKPDLRESLAVLQQASAKLKKQVVATNTLCHQLKNTKCLKS